MQIVYIDILFAINFIMDYVILLIVDQIMQTKVIWYRKVVGSIFAAFLYCISLYVPVFQGVLSIPYAIFIPCFPILWVFKPKSIQYFIRVWVTAMIVAFIMGGAIFNFYYSFQTVWFKKPLSFLFICFGGCSVGICFFVLFKWIRRQLVEPHFLYTLEFMHKGKKCCVLSLLDTGNSLYTVFKHEPVIIITYDKVKAILPILWQNCIEEYLQKGAFLVLEQKKYAGIPIRCIPFSSVGKKEGMLVGIVIEELKITKEARVYTFKNCVVGIGEEGLFAKEAYDALLHPDFITYS